MKRFTLMTSAAAVALAGLTGAVFAQEAEDAAAGDAGRSDVITVTARRREEGLLDAPIAVSAFSDADIDRLGIESVDDVARFTPGLSFSAAFARSGERPVIRGQSNVLAEVQFGVESGTAYFVDGIYYPGTTSSLDPNDIERVEVIKGPQSALYGRNTYAGAINYVTRGATEEFEANARLRAGSYGEREVALRVSGPLAEDRLGYSLTFRDYNYDGEFNNTLTGGTTGGQSSLNFSGVIDASFTPNWDVRLRAMYYEDDDGPIPIFLQSSEDNNCFPGLRSLSTFSGSGSSNANQYFCGVIQPAPVALNTDEVTTPRVVAGVPQNPGVTNPFFNQDLYNTADGTAFDGIARDGVLGAVQSNWDIGGSGYNLQINAQSRFEEDYFGSDSDHSAVNWFLVPAFLGPNPEALGGEPFFANTNRGETRDYSFEAKLESPSDARFRWMIGAYYYDEQEENFEFDFANIDTGGVLQNVLTIENQAAFGLVEYDFTDALTVTLEARVAEETKTREEYDAAGVLTLDQEGSFDSFTPRLTVDYSLGAGGTIYGVFAQGVKPGGLNGSDGQLIGRPTYEQEESDNFEIGYKNSYFGGDAVFTGAAYFIEASDVQVTQAIGSTTGNAVTSVAINQAGAEIRGVELSWNHTATDAFRYGLTYAWTDAEFTEGCDDFQWTLTSGGGLLTPGSTAPGTGTDFTGNGNCSIAGNRLPLTSEHQASAFGEYRVPILGGSWEFFTQADVTYESSKFVQVHNLAETGAATLVGARIGIETDTMSFRIWGRNLTDEDSIVMATRWLQTPYFTGLALRDPAIFATGGDLGSPRAFFGTLRRGPSVGVEARINF